MQHAAEVAATKQVRSVAMALRVLELLARSDAPRRVTEMAETLGETKARVHRHLRTLVTAGYVQQDMETERYQPSIKLFLLGQRLADRFDFMAAARDAMRWLRDELGHTVVIGRPEEHGIVILDMVRGASPIEFGTRPGSVFPYHATAQGKVALAFGAAGLREGILSGSLTRETARTICDPCALLAELEQVKRRGWAGNAGELVSGVNGVAAPILDSAGEIAGTIAIIESAQFLTATPTDAQIAAVLEAARRASRLPEAG